MCVAVCLLKYEAIWLLVSLCAIEKGKAHKFFFVDICYRTVIVTKCCVIGPVHTGMLAIIYRVFTCKMVVPYSVTSA